MQRAPSRRPPRPRGPAPARRPHPAPAHHGDPESEARERGPEPGHRVGPRAGVRRGGVPGGDDDGDPHGDRANCRSPGRGIEPKACPPWLFSGYRAEKLPGGRTQVRLRPYPPGYGKLERGRPSTPRLDRRGFAPSWGHSTHGPRRRSIRDELGTHSRNIVPDSPLPRPSSPAPRRCPAADEATYERVDGGHPGLPPDDRAGVQRRRARARRGRRRLHRASTFHELSRAGQEELLLRWQTDPVLKAPLAAVSLIFKFVHFDRPEVYGTLGGKLNVVKALEEPRWLSQVHRADAWPDDEVECEVVVVGHGRGRRRRRAGARRRGDYAVVFVEEGEHHRRDAFDGRAIEAHKRFYRGAFSVGNAPMPIFMGRLVGGSTAINGGTSLRTPPWVLERWCDEIGTDAFSPDVDGAVLREGRALAARGAVTARHHRPHRRLRVPRLRRARLEPPGHPAQRTGLRRQGLLRLRLPYRRTPGHEPLVHAGRRSGGARSASPARASSRSSSSRDARSGSRRSHPRGAKCAFARKAVVLAGGAIPTPLLLLRQGLANHSGQVGRNLSVHPSTGYAAVAPERIEAAGAHPAGLRLRPVPARRHPRAHGAARLQRLGRHLPVRGPAPHGGRRSHRPHGVVRHPGERREGKRARLA